jgi:hypothetical protein
MEHLIYSKNYKIKSKYSVYTYVASCLITYLPNDAVSHLNLSKLNVNLFGFLIPINQKDYISEYNMIHEDLKLKF